MFREVIAIFAESLPGRGRSYPREVIVDSINYPKYLTESPRVKGPGRCWKVIVDRSPRLSPSDRGYPREVIVKKLAYYRSLRTGGRLAWSRKPPLSTSIRAR